MKKPPVLPAQRAFEPLVYAKRHEQLYFSIFLRYHQIQLIIEVVSL